MVDMPESEKKNTEERLVQLEERQRVIVDSVAEIYGYLDKIRDLLGVRTTVKRQLKIDCE
jgi:hypothetical protein